MAGEQQRFWKVVRTWLVGDEGASSYPEDPEELLARAQQEMRDLHARNRERAVQAITQKNNLQQIVADTQKRMDTLREKAELAQRRGDNLLAEQLWAERSQYELTLEQTRLSLQQAEAITEQVKLAIRREEAKIRQKTAQALALRAQWKVLQLNREVVRAARAVRQGTGDGLSSIPAAERARILLGQAQQQRDELASLTEGTGRVVVELREKAAIARSRNDEEMERALLREMEQNEATLAQMREALAQAIDVTTRAEKYLNGETDAVDIVGWETVGEAERETASIVAQEKRDWVTYAAMIGLVVLIAALTLLFLLWLIG